MVDVHVSFYIPRYKKNRYALNFKSIQEHVTIWIQTVQECKKGHYEWLAQKPNVKKMYASINSILTSYSETLRFSDEICPKRFNKISKQKYDFSSNECCRDKLSYKTSLSLLLSSRLGSISRSWWPFFGVVIESTFSVLKYE